jgi:hypothetical protein
MVMFKKFKIKSAKEIGEEWKENWDKFVQGFNDFFGIQDSRNISSDHTSKETAFDITPEELRREIEQDAQNRADVMVPENGQKDSRALSVWDQSWKKFTDNMMNSFSDMKQKVDSINRNNLEKLEEQIKIGKANYNLWLEKNEIRNASIKEKQELALQRFAEWSKSNQENLQVYFDNQRKEWQSQIEKWKNNAQEMPEKWLANREKMRKDYEEWIERRRKRSLERIKFKIKKSNLKMKLQLRRSFNMLLFFIPIIIVVALILALINAIGN